MRLYLASSFRNAHILRDLKAELKEEGHEVIDEWWNIDGKAGTEHLGERLFHSIPNVRAIAERHWRAIDNCDALVIVTDGSGTQRFTGANIEVGYAIGIGKPVLSFGFLERSAMYSPVVQCEDLGELADALATLDYTRSR